MSKTPVMVLQEVCQKKNFPPPVYEITHAVTGTHQNRFDYQVCVNGILATGTGSSKQISKHKAAHNLLMKFRDMNIYNPTDNPVNQFQTSPDNSHNNTTLNYIGPLKDVCLENKIPDAIFTLVSDCGPPHMKEFTYECKIAGITTLGRGNTKKMAKHVAAKEMMERIKDVMPELQLNFSKKQEEQLKAINSKDDAVLQQYNKLYGNIVVDKTANVANYALTLKKLMVHFERTLDDFIEDLSDPCETALERIVSKLELKYNFLQIQDDPSVVVLSLTTDTPFTSIGLGHDEESAKAAAIESAFQMMNIFMRLELPES